MSETYIAKRILTGPYTNFYAEAVGATPQTLDTGGIISTEHAVQRLHKRALSTLIEAYLDVSDVAALPTYPVKGKAGDAKTYGKIVYAQHRLFESILQRRTERGIAPPVERLFSVGYCPDGYIPEPGESVQDVVEHVTPQVSAAAHLGYTPVGEATASKDRLRGIWRAANTAEVPVLRVGIAFDSRGEFAADGTTLQEALAFIDRNEDGLSTKVILGANCGSCTGIDKAAKRNPGALQFACANSRDIPDKRALKAAGNSNGSVHHHGEPVTTLEFAGICKIHKFPDAGLCCGFGPTELAEFKAEFRAEPGQ